MRRQRAPVKARELRDQKNKWEEPTLLDTAWDACMCLAPEKKRGLVIVLRRSECGHVFFSDAANYGTKNVPCKHRVEYCADRSPAYRYWCSSEAAGKVCSVYLRRY